MMNARIGASVSIMVMEAVIASVRVVVVSVLLAGNLLVVSIMFLVSVAAISRVVARSVTGALRAVVVTIRVMFSVAGLRVVALV